ncbi:flagellin, partial [Paenibacillus sp. PsM32]|nr:flagellin [Paenibacillus sp. PsM32]
MGTQIDNIMSQTSFNGISITKGVTIQVGDKTGVTISIGAITTTSFKGLNSSTSLASIEDAIKGVATERAKLGAKQNRLEYT